MCVCVPSTISNRPTDLISFTFRDVVISFIFLLCESATNGGRSLYSSMGLLAACALTERVSLTLSSSTSLRSWMGTSLTSCSNRIKPPAGWCGYDDVSCADCVCGVHPHQFTHHPRHGMTTMMGMMMTVISMTVMSPAAFQVLS